MRNWQYIRWIVQLPGKDHANVDGLSRITDTLVQCNYYSYGCKYCVRASEQWDRFHDEVDYVVPLVVRHISHDGSDVEPRVNITWVDKYKAWDLRKMELEDETTAQIIRWLENDHKLIHAELALAIPEIKYVRLLLRQLGVVSCVV